MVITTWERSAPRLVRRVRAEAQPVAPRRVRSHPPPGRRRAVLGRLLAELAQAYAWSRVLGG